MADTHFDKLRPRSIRDVSGFFVSSIHTILQRWESSFVSSNVHLARPSSSLDNRTKLNTQPTDYVPRDALCIVNVIAEIAAKAGKIKFRARRLKIKNSHSRSLACLLARLSQSNFLSLSTPLVPLFSFPAASCTLITFCSHSTIKVLRLDPIAKLRTVLSTAAENLELEASASSLTCQLAFGRGANKRFCENLYDRRLSHDIVSGPGRLPHV